MSSATRPDSRVADTTVTACPHDGGRPPEHGLVNRVRFDLLTLESLHARIGGFIACGRSHVVHFCAADPTVLARRDLEYREVVNRGDLNVADGVPVAWALRLFGKRTERIAGSDAFSYLVDRGRAQSIRHYLFGGSPEVVLQLRSELDRRYPGIQIVGAESPPFRELSDAEVGDAAERIRSTGTDLLWIGLGAPKQDIMAQRLRAVDAAPVILCVGAAFDFLSGGKKRAPAWMQRTGLEWLHRLVCEPRRLWRRYLVGNPRFVAGVVCDLVTGRRPSQ